MIKIITDSTIKTGVGRYALNLSIALSAELISLRKDNSKKLSDYGGTIMNGIRTGGITSGYYLNERYSKLAFRNCERYLKKSQVDDMILHYSNPGIRKFDLKVQEVVTFHDLFPLKNKGPGKIEKIKVKNFLSFMNSGNILTISNVVMNDLKKYGFKGNIQVIHHPVSQNFRKLSESKESIRKKLNLPINKKLILSVSTAALNKNLNVVQKTLKLLGNNYNLVRVGPELNDSINFQNIDEEQLYMIYNACDVLLIPSSSEGFGFPVIEAFATGLPVVASDIEIFREITRDSAILSKIDPEELSHSVVNAIDQREAYSNKGLETAKYYSFDNFKNNVRSYYSKNFGINFNE